jgi:hypothetical protein
MWINGCRAAGRDQCGSMAAALPGAINVAPIERTKADDRDRTDDRRRSGMDSFDRRYPLLIWFRESFWKKTERSDIWPIDSWQNIRFCLPGTDVVILKIFLPKNLAKKLAVFFAQTTDSFWKNCDHNIGF